MHETEVEFTLALYKCFEAGTVPLCPDGCHRTNFLASVLHTYPDRVFEELQ